MIATLTRIAVTVSVLIMGLLVTAACNGNIEASHQDPDHAGSTDTAVSAASNRIPIPAAVRRNLGLTFARAEYRAVERIRRLPGWFEPIPSAEFHYAMPAAGRVTVHVEPLDTVVVGDLLFTVDAPDWRRLQGQLSAVSTELAEVEARVARARAAQMAAQQLDAGSEVNEPDVFAADVTAARAAMASVAERRLRLVAEAAALTGLEVGELTSVDETGTPGWRALATLPVRASAPGRVRTVQAATGAWVGAGEELMHVVDPNRLRFHGRALQADLHELRDGLSCYLVQPQGRGRDIQERATGTIRLGVTGNAETRTVDVFVEVAQPLAWMRPQVAAVCEVVLDGSLDYEELAIPRRAVIADGSQRVFFRRDPDDPDVAIRTVLDSGPSDGAWITVYSGIAEGHEVVVDGIYELKLATTVAPPSSAHVHPDGTVCEDSH